MRESFIFYDSFLNALDELDSDIKLQVYDAISHYALKNIEPELNGIAKAIFLLIKPQIDANNKRYENGKKGAGFGKLGGRPKKQKPQRNPKETPNENVNENVNENENENVNENDLGFLGEENLENFSVSKIDPFADPLIDKTFKIYSENCPDLCKIRFERKNVDIRKLTAKVLSEIDRDIGVFKELCIKANKLKVIVDKPIDYKKMLNCYQQILNGAYEEAKQKSPQELFLEKMRKGDSQ